MLCVLGAAAFAMVLSACVRVDVMLSVTADDEVNGMLVVAVDRGLLELDDEGLPDLLAPLYDAVPTHLDGVTTHPYDVDGFVGRTYLFDQVPLDEFNAGMGLDPEAWLRIDRRGETFEVTGVIDRSPSAVRGALQGAPGDDDLARFAEGADVEVRLSFPGHVQSASGEVAARTVTWVAPVGEATPLTATASASTRPTLQDLVGWPLVVTGVLVLLLVLWWLVHRFDVAVDAERVARRAPRRGSATALPPIPARWSAAHLPASDRPSYDTTGGDPD